MVERPVSQFMTAAQKLKRNQMIPLLEKTALSFCWWLFLLPCFAWSQNATLTNPSSCGLNLLLTDYSCPENGLFFSPDIFDINVTNAPGTALGQDVYLKEVRLLIQHEWTGDLDIVLIAPSGLSIDLSSDNGGGEDNYGDSSLAACTGATRFTATSCISITEGMAPFTSSSFLPEESFFNFNDNTTNPNGTWQLQICDDVQDDTGTLEYVELVFEPIICLPFIDFEVLNIDTTTAALNWSPNGNCGTAIIEYGPPGFTPGIDSTAGGGQVVFANCPPYNLENLLPDANLDVYIRKYCGNGFSSNSCALSVQTGCQPPPATIQTTFDEAATCTPLFCGQACTIDGSWWNNTTNDDFDWLINSGSTTTFGTGPSDDISGGGNYVYIETSGAACLNGNQAYLMSNCIQLDKQGTDTCHLSFYYHMFGDNIASLDLEVSTDGGFNWQTLWSETANQGDQWLKAYISLDAYSDGSILQFRFTGEGQNGSRGDIALDHITFHGSLDLGRPNNLYYLDADGDGFGNPLDVISSCLFTPLPGYVFNNLDCNDDDPDINPNAPEIPCDNIDNNCNSGLLEDDAILPPVEVTNDTVCSGVAAILCATAEFGGFIFWYDSPTSTNPISVGTCYFPDLPPNNSPVPQVYRYYVEENNFLCLSGERSEAVVIVNPRPDVISADQPSICPGQSFDLNGLNILDANLTGSNITFHSESPASAANQLSTTLVNPTSGTIYYFLATSPDGCTDEANVFLDVKSGPELSFSPAATFNLCKESVQTIEAFPSGGSAPYSFQWSTGSTSSTTDVEAAFLAGTVDSYSLTVTDQEGCFTSEEVLVTTSSSIDSIRRTITNVSTCNGMDGVISLTPLNGVSPFQYVWESSNGITGSASNITDTLEITNLPQGEYNITITDASSSPCAFILKTVLVNGPGAIVNDITVEHVSCRGASDGTICLDILGDNPVITWSNGANSPCIENLSGGFYSATITDGACENVISNIELMEPDSLSSNSKTSLPSCFDTMDGAIDITVFGGTPPFDFSWSNGSNFEDLINLAGGLYTVTITDANDCQLIETVLLEAPAPLELSIDSLSAISCQGLDDGYVLISAAGGTSPYQYDWSTGSTAPVLANLAEGLYTLTLSDFNNCQETINSTIIEPEPIVVSLLNSQNPQCFGDETGQIEVQAEGGVPPYSFTWNTGASGSLLTNLGVGTYTVSVSDANNCPIDTLEVRLEALSNLDLTVLINPPSCVGQTDGSITLQPNGIGPFSYSWGNNTLNAIGVGDYPVSIEDGQGCQFDTTITVDAPQLFGVEISSSHPSCHDTNDGAINVNLTASGTPPLDFEWNTGSSSINLIPAAPGDYVLTITDFNDCTFISDTITLENPPSLEIEVNSVENISCNGDASGSIEITASGGVPPYTYNWTGTESNLSTAFNLDAGNYSLVVLDANDCPIENTFTIEEPLALQVEVTINQGAICEDTDNKLLAEVSGGTAPYQYLWSNGATDSCLVDVAPGDYNLSLTDANNCTQIINSIKVRETFEELQLDSFIVSDITCNGAADGAMTAFISGGAPPYRFHFSNNHIVDTTATRVTCSNLPLDFDYRVTVSSLTTGCSVVSQTEAVLEPPLLIINLDSSNFVNCFGGLDGAIYVSATGGTPNYNFEWFEVNDPETLISTNEDLVNIPSGTYFAVVRDANACTDTLTPVSIGNANEVLEIVEPLTMIQDVACKGDSTGSINITPSGGSPPYSFEWSNGAISQDIFNLAAGIYTLTLTDSDTCRLIFPLFEVEEPLTGITIESELTHLLCKEIEDGAITLSVSGGTEPYSYVWQFEDEFLDADSCTISNLEDGSYFVAIQDDSNCTAIESFELTAPPLFEVNIDLDPPMPPNNGMAEALAEGGVPDYRFMWNTGAESQTIEINSGGIFSVTVTDENDCVAVDSAFLVNTLEVNPLSALEVYPNPSTGKVFIETNFNQITKLELEVYNILGERIEQYLFESLNGKVLNIDLSSSPPGLYIFVFRDENQNWFIEKVQLSN